MERGWDLGLRRILQKTGLLLDVVWTLQGRANASLRSVARIFVLLDLDHDIACVYLAGAKRSALSLASRGCVELIDSWAEILGALGCRHVDSRGSGARSSAAGAAPS